MEQRTIPMAPAALPPTRAKLAPFFIFGLRRCFVLKAGTRFALVLGLLVGSAVAASAETFTVTLKNGTTVATRYQPQRASWDQSRILVFTGRGNWASFAEGDIAKVELNAEKRRAGERLDAKTVFLGYTANNDPSAVAEARQQFDQPAPSLGRGNAQFLEPGEFGSGNTGAVPYVPFGSSFGGAQADPTPSPAPAPAPAPSSGSGAPSAGSSGGEQ